MKGDNYYSRLLSIANGKKPPMDAGQKEDEAKKKRKEEGSDENGAPKASPYALPSTTSSSGITVGDSDDTNHTYSKPTSNFSQWSLHNNSEMEVRDQQYNVSNSNHTASSLLPPEAEPSDVYNFTVLGLFGILVVFFFVGYAVKRARNKRSQYQEIQTLVV